MKKLIRITTVPISLRGLLKGQLNFMSQFYETVGISSGGEILDQVSFEENIRVIPIEMTRKISPFKDLIALWKLYLVLKREKPFIVHTHTPKAGTLGMLAAYLAGIQHRFHTIAGLPLLEANGPKRWLLNCVEKITYSCATRVYPNSKGLKSIVLDNGFASPNKLKVLGKGSSNGIDTDYFDPTLFSEFQKKELKTNLNISETDFVFLFVGRLVKDKGINELILAFELILGSNSNLKLLLVGPFENNLDPLSPETERSIESSPQVIHTGWKEDVRPYFAISNCFVFPSYREGFPNVVMQAGAMELFSIVTDINGCNEIIEDGINGIIIPPKDIKALANAMLKCSENFEDLKNHSSKYRELIKKRYERVFIWEELLKEYKSLE